MTAPADWLRGRRSPGVERFRTLTEVDDPSYRAHRDPRRQFHRVRDTWWNLGLRLSGGDQPSVPEAARVLAQRGALTVWEKETLQAVAGGVLVWRELSADQARQALSEVPS